MSEMFSRVRDYQQTLEEGRFGYLKDCLTSGFDIAFSLPYGGSGEVVISRVRKSTGGLLAYELVLEFSHAGNQKKGKVTGIVGYRKKWRPGFHFDEKMTKSAQAIDITGGSEIDGAASDILTDLSRYDYLASLLKRF